MTDFLDDLATAIRTPATPRSGKNRLEPDFQVDFDAWKASPTPQTASAMLKRVNPIIDSAVKPLGDSPILRSRAKELTLQALQGYDPSQASIRTYLMNNLQGLRRIHAQQSQAIQVPERVVLNKQLIDRETINLTDELGREPSDSELAARVNLSPARIQYVRQYQRPISGSRAAGPEGNDPAVIHGRDQTARAIAQDFIYQELNPRDQLIYDYTLGEHGREAVPANEIARRLGITPSAVSQRLAAIQKRLDTLNDLELFGG